MPPVPCRRPLKVFRAAPAPPAMSVADISDMKAWETDVMNAPVPVLVDFWAEWCGPCRMVSPIIEELASDYDGRVNFAKVNVDKAQDLAAKYTVMSIPTVILFNKGEEVAKQVGAASKDNFAAMIDRALG